MPREPRELRQWLLGLSGQDIAMASISGFVRASAQVWRGPPRTIQRFGDQRSALLVAYGSDRHPIGWVRVDQVYLHILYVVERYRRLGIATALYRQVAALGFPLADLRWCVRSPEGIVFREAMEQPEPATKAPWPLPTSAPGTQEGAVAVPRAELSWAGERGSLLQIEPRLF